MINKSFQDYKSQCPLILYHKFYMFHCLFEYSEQTSLKNIRKRRLKIKNLYPLSLFHLAL
jgi:hypothetical protein